MRTYGFVRNTVAAFGVAALLVLALPQALSQTFSASAGTTAAALPVHTVPQSSGKHKKTEMPLLFGQVRNGVYTVDGMVAKVQLNYNVEGARCMYLFVPGLGTAVLSAERSANTVVSEAKLDATELSFALAGHTFHLTGLTLEDKKGKQPEHLYVRLDRDSWQLARRPMIGFGKATASPYEWPGALPPAAVEQAEEVNELAPPVPSSMLPKLGPAAAAHASAPVARPVSLQSVAHP